MLKCLNISNYALIDKLELDLSSGLTIVTGETGAGKSIIMGALMLLLGERADSRIVTDGTAKTVVEATFDVAAYGLEPLFAASDIDYNEHECILRREVSATGRSRAFVNDTPVTLALLRDIATRLIDIHSQHNNMLLADPAYQLRVLDSIADNQEALTRYRELYRQMVTAQRDLQELQQQLERDKAELDYISFQHNQLAELNLIAGEDADLEAEHTMLANVETLKEQLWDVTSLLDNDEHSMLTDLQTIVNRLDAAADKMGDVAELSERVKSCLIELKDVCAAVRTAEERLQHDPQRLQQIDDRLNAIYELERKHNVHTVDELLQLQHSLAQRMNAITAGDDRVAALQQQVAQSRAQAQEVAATLHRRREQAAEQLTEQLSALAATLAMRNLKFVIDFAQCDLCPTGADAVNFLFAFNKNQTPMSVKDTASGGEISRVMLCVKTVMARVMQLPTIVFDEVDTGVSGDVADMIGKLMSEIAAKIQVIAITHLPQVAACAHSHLLVYKTDEQDRTITRVTALDDEGHLREVARMLSGRDVDRAALDNARSLINQHKSFK